MTRQADIDAARVLIKIMKHDGRKIPPWMHNLANSEPDGIRRGEAGGVEVQYRLMSSTDDEVRNHFGFMVLDPHGMQKVIERHREAPDPNDPDELWIERREVTITPWERIDE